MRLLRQVFLYDTLLKWRIPRSTIVFGKIVVAVLLFFFTVLLFLNSALADEVYLKNGDLLTGDILSTEEDRLVIQTDYAKKVKVQLDKVVCLTSDKEVTLLLKNKEKMVGLIGCPELGSIQLMDQGTGETMEIPVSDLKAINPPPPPPPVTYKALVNLGGAINEGNTETRTFNSSGRFQARSKRHRLNLEGKFNYGESEGEENERNWLLGAKHDYFVSKKIYAYLRPLAEYDKFQDLDLRLVVSAGPGYQVIDTETTSLFAEAGPAYFYEDYGDAGDKDYLAARWAAGLKFDIIRDKLKFFHLHELFQDLTADEGLFLRTEQGIRLSLIKNLFLNFQVDYQYKSDPPEGNKSSDTALILGVSYELNF
jgi:putative salt-induced outer membrane protein YdiY